MINRIKEYLEYRKNKRTAKHELTKLGAVTLPIVNNSVEKFKTDNARIMEIFNYIISLSPEDIQKIIVHAMVETMPDNTEE